MQIVMINNALAYLRKHKNEFVHHDIDLIAENETDPVEEDVLTIENQIKNTNFTREELIEIIESLPEGYQQVLNLFVIDEFKHQEIAIILNINEGTSKSQLNRARKLVKKRLYEKVLEKESLKQAKQEVI
jgi:RNA polymerase sigma-70 factor (ECF subfamily)